MKTDDWLRPLIRHVPVKFKIKSEVGCQHITAAVTLTKVNGLKGRPLPRIDLDTFREKGTSEFNPG